MAYLKNITVFNPKLYLLLPPIEFKWNIIGGAVNIEAGLLWVWGSGSLKRHFFTVSYVEERPWWPIQSPNKGRKKKASS